MSLQAHIIIQTLWLHFICNTTTGNHEPPTEFCPFPPKCVEKRRNLDLGVIKFYWLRGTVKRHSSGMSHLILKPRNIQD